MSYPLDPSETINMLVSHTDQHSAQSSAALHARQEGRMIIAVICVGIVFWHAIFVWPPDWRDEWIQWVRSLPEVRE